MSWYLYISKGKTGRYYTGISTEPKTRMVKHNDGRGSRFAWQQGPLELLYVSSRFNSKSEARKREVQVKGWSREKKEKLISGKWS